MACPLLIPGAVTKSSASGFVLAEPLSGIGKEFSQNAVTSTRDRVNHKSYGGSTTPPFNTYESPLRSLESELFCGLLRSSVPGGTVVSGRRGRKWRYLDSNQGPRAYESLALTN